MKTTTAEKSPAAAAKLRDLIEDVSVAMIVTVTPDGRLRSRPMVTQDVTMDGELWFLTSDESGMASDLSEEQAVNVAYAEPARDHYVSVTGSGTLVKDRQKLQGVWQPEYTRYFPKGLEDPHLAILRVRIETAEYWDAAATRMVKAETEPQVKTENSSDGNRPMTRGAKASPPAAQPSKGSSEGKAEHAKIDIRATPASG